MNKFEKVLSFIFIIGVMLLISGCGKKHYYDLPKNPIVFEDKTFVNPDDENDKYSLLEYNDRKYVLYGTLKDSIDVSEIKSCLGYKEDREGLRVFALNNTDDYLMVRDIENDSELLKPSFYRAIDTVDMDIDIPSYIKSFDYDYWKIEK